MNDKILKAYRASENYYDRMVTAESLLGKAYIKFFWGNSPNEAAERSLGFIPCGFSGKLLDVPVGTGIFTVKKYKSLPDAEITALDYSEGMLSQALRRFSENNISNVEFVRGDVSALPFFNETFDIVMSMNGFHVFPNKETAFYETARVLKKGGILCGCFYIRGRFRPTDFLVNSIMARKGWFTPPFYTKEELTAQFKRYYSKVEVYNIKAEAYFRCVK